MTHFIETVDYQEFPERIVTGVSWSVPTVELREGRWLAEVKRQSTRRASVPRGGLLRRFCELRKDGEIKRFAQTYGLLYLCADHHLPQFHDGSCAARYVDEERLQRGDALDDWRLWVRRFEGTTRVTRAILTRQQPRPEDVDAMFEGVDSRSRFSFAADMLRRPKASLFSLSELEPSGARELPRRTWTPQDFDTQLGYVVEWLNSLLQAAHVRRAVVQPAGRHALAVVDGNSPTAPLFGALVLDLAAACARVNTLARCENCGRGFKAARVTSSYCPKCAHPQIRWKLAQRRRREQNRAKGLTARGNRLKSP
jgi:hypothetical protein